MRVKHSLHQSGFTMVEVIVATAIFVIVVVAMLGLFTQTLQINRRVQTVRELVQGTRAFTETITREIRNGRIDYTGGDTGCNVDYNVTQNQSLSIETRDGESLCFYLAQDGDFKLRKRIDGQTFDESIFPSDRFRIIEDTFRFHVFPDTDPNDESNFPEIQPFVTIVAQFELDGTGAGNESAVINYQTTISTDVYDIPKSE